MTDSIYYLLIIACFIMGMAFNASAQPSARDLCGPAPVLPLASEPDAKLVVDR